MKVRRPRTTAGNKTICIPIGPDQNYATLVRNTKAYRAYLDQMIEIHPELFPPDIDQGYCFHGFVKSSRLGIVTRRLRLKSNGEAYQLRPDTVMPYMIGTSAEVEKGLYLRRYGLPYEAIAHVLGHSAMYWYRATEGLSRISMVGSLVKDPDCIPEHLVCDEKRTWRQGHRVYVATTVASGCFLGVGASQSADTDGLTQAYGDFKQEAQALNPDYDPKSVNTDGWESRCLSHQ